MINKGILVLGSNFRKEEKIEKARKALQSLFPDICFAEAVYTKPVDCNCTENFLNQVAAITTGHSQEQVCCLLKEIECSLGRTPGDKAKCQIPIDIDLVMWNNSILKPADLSREYIHRGIEELETSQATYSRQK